MQPTLTGDVTERNDQLTENHAGGDAKRVRVVIIGTGFSGLGMAIRMKQRGYDDFIVLEARR